MFGQSLALGQGGIVNENTNNLPIPGGRSKFFGGLGLVLWLGIMGSESKVAYLMGGVAVVFLLWAFTYPRDPVSWVGHFWTCNCMPATYYLYYDNGEVKWKRCPKNYPYNLELKPKLPGLVLESFTSLLFAGNVCSVYWGEGDTLQRRKGWTVRLQLWNALHGGKDSLLVLRDPLGIRHSMTLERLFSAPVQKAVRDNTPLLDVLYREAEAQLRSA